MAELFMSDDQIDRYEKFGEEPPDHIKKEANNKARKKEKGSWKDKMKANAPDAIDNSHSKT